MKKVKNSVNALLFLSVIFLAGCNTPAQKVENAENKVADANEDLDRANEEYVKEIAQYRAETNERILANDKSAAEFKKRIENDKKDAKADYNKRIAELEQKNSDMRRKMDDYKADTKENWEKFKTEFNHDMDELGTAFKDLTVKNVKQ